ncbi:MAG: CHAD domain-containing protein, partial [Planctomycetes bacterium]|nr:CHAD domain-containing protein [Planctomycetota bacterium]
MRRVALKQIERALEMIARDGAPDAHEPRKCVKRLRALVRLCRVGLPTAQREALDRDLRTVGRALGRLRDAEAMPQTLAELRHPAKPLATLRQVAQAELDQARNDAQPSLIAAVAGLQAVTGRLGESLPAGGWKALVEGLADNYRRGRRLHAALDADADSDAFHGLRKRVKNLNYQARLFIEGGADIAALVHATSALGERLGEEHDLAVLGERLNAGWGGLTGEDRCSVLA